MTRSNSLAKTRGTTEEYERRPLFRDLFIVHRIPRRCTSIGIMLENMPDIHVDPAIESLNKDRCFVNASISVTVLL